MDEQGMPPADGDGPPNAVESANSDDNTPVGPEESVEESPAADALFEAPEEPSQPLGSTSQVIPEPVPLSSHGPARIISMVNQKGGVGKTTSTVSLGAALAGYGRRVLLVDFDPQGALSVALGVNAYELDLTVYNLLTQPD